MFQDGTKYWIALAIWFVFWVFLLFFFVERIFENNSKRKINVKFKQYLI